MNPETKKVEEFLLRLLWAQQDLNLWPPDYESGATNQLSYGPYLQMEKYSLPLQNLMQK